MHNIYLLDLIECIKYAFNILVVSDAIYPDFGVGIFPEYFLYTAICNIPYRPCVVPAVEIVAVHQAMDLLLQRLDLLLLRSCWARPPLSLVQAPS